MQKEITTNCGYFHDVNSTPPPTPRTPVHTTYSLVLKQQVPEIGCFLGNLPNKISENNYSN